MSKILELKAKMYDLLVRKQEIELEMQRTNQAIIDLQKQESEKEVETKDVPQS